MFGAGSGACRRRTRPATASIPQLPRPPARRYQSDIARESVNDIRAQKKRGGLLLLFLFLRFVEHGFHGRVAVGEFFDREVHGVVVRQAQLVR